MGLDGWATFMAPFSEGMTQAEFVAHQAGRAVVIDFMIYAMGGVSSGFTIRGIIDAGEITNDLCDEVLVFEHVMKVEEYFRNLGVPTLWMIDGSRFSKMGRLLLTFDADNQARIVRRARHMANALAVKLASLPCPNPQIYLQNY